MSTLPRIRVFISSPADVRPERLLAERVVARLDREFSYHFHIDAVLWEREPLVATHHFQDPRNIPRASSADIVVVILWSRLGVPLPDGEYSGAISGRPVTGTEWEFEDALAAAREHGGIPDLLVYRKRASVIASLDDDAILEAQRQQKKQLEDFISRWFGSAENNDIRAASHAFLTTQEFEDAVYEHLKALLERRVGRMTEVSIRWHEAPFRGLESFDLEHAQIFFGRTRARNELREALGRQVGSNAADLIIVSGASGSGKSSLVKAGLLPDLMLPGMLGRVALCRYAAIRPSGAQQDPLHTLAAAILSDTALPELRELRYDAARLESLLRDAPAQAALPVEQGLEQASKAANLIDTAEARLVIIIDQFEELFTDTGITLDARNAFVAAIDALARTKLVWVIATLRSDFLDRLNEFPELQGIANSDALFFLGPPNDAEFGQMIRQPALEAGLRFETRAIDGASLDETIRKAATEDPNVLPLLSFLLDELWRNRRPNGELTFEAYDALGGLEGALARRADAVFAELPADVQATLPRVLRALVTVESDSQITARIALLRDFPQGSPERVLIDAFAAPDARLIVKMGNGRESVVRVTHEALLTKWEKAASSLAVDRVDLELIARLRRDVARWRSTTGAESGTRLLPSGLPLEEARDLLARWHGELDADVVTYIEASALAEKSRRSIRRKIVTGAFAVLATISIIALWEWRTAAVERHEALVAQSRFLARDAEKAVDAGDAVTGILLALEALPKNIAHPDRPFVPEAEYALEDALGYQREFQDFNGHERSVNSAAFSPDGHRIVSASADHTVRIWDIASHRSTAVLRGHDGPVYTAAFSPDGKRIASASYDHTIRIWDAQTGAPLLVLRGHDAPVESAAFSADGQRIVSASDDLTVRIWNASTGAQLRVLHGHERQVNAAAFSPDGHRIVSASDDQTVRVWDAATGATTAVLRGHENWIRAATFSHDGRRVASASGDKTVRIWDAASGAPLAVLRGHTAPVWGVAFSPDDRHVVSASFDKTVRIWDASSGAQIAILGGNEDFVTGTSFSPDGRSVVSASWDKTVRLWDASNGPQIALFRGHEGSVYAARFSPDQRHVISASEDKTLRLWDLATAAQTRVFRGHAGWIRSVSYSPDGRHIVSASADKTVRIWNVGTGAQEHVLRGHDLSVWTAAYSPDGRSIASGSDDKTVRLWDALTGAPKSVLRGHGDRIWSVAFGPDGRQLVSASADGTARVWDSASGAQLLVLRGHEGDVDSARFSPDGKRIVTASEDKTVRVWDAATGAQIAVLPGHDDRVWSAAYSNDGSRIVSASADQTVRVWDSTTFSPIAILRGHEDEVFSAEFSSDGKRIVSASEDKSVRAWDVATGNRRLPGFSGATLAAAGSEDRQRAEQAIIDTARATAPRLLSADQLAAEYLSNATGPGTASPAAPPSNP